MRLILIIILMFFFLFWFTRPTLLYNESKLHQKKEQKQLINTESVKQFEANIVVSMGLIRLSGMIYYENSKLFHLELSSFFGPELDIGSNNEYFWYWSRRDSEPGLHFAKHEDFYKSRMK